MEVNSSQPLSKDWNLCALCEENTDEKLICPVNSTGSRQNYGSGYKTLADNLVKFKEVGCLPIKVEWSRLDDGYGIVATLTNHRASWHKSCYNRCSRLKLERAQKRKLDDCSLPEAEAPSPIKTRASLGCVENSELRNACFFCDVEEGTLHRAATLDIDNRVRAAATQLQDRKLLAKLAVGDMHAVDAYYHATCLTSLYNRVRVVKQETATEKASELCAQAIALAELITFIEEKAQVANSPTVFKLSELVKLYSSRLQQLGAHVPERINSTRLKERLLSHMPDLQAYSEGREVRLAFSGDIKAAFQFAENHSYDAQAVHLVKAASFIRQELLRNQPHFTGSFEADCQRQAVPYTLLTLINMILEGSNIKDQNEEADKYTSTAALVISQLLIFNSVKHQRDKSTESPTLRHSQVRETPLPVYIGTVIHAETRKKKLVDKFYRLGLSISYDRVMQISADLGNSVCEQFEKEGVVCPPKLKRSLFTTGNVDNIDHNPSSRTSKDSFHGTAISLTQHPSTDALGTDRNQVLINSESPKKKSLSTLPVSYTDIQPVFMKAKKDIFVPRSSESSKPPSDLIDTSMVSEYKWLNKVEEQLDKEKLEEKTYISWSAYFASLRSSQDLRPTAITGLLPLFHENAHTEAMIQHSMKVIKEAVQYLNPGQTSIIAMDQPLFAIAKQIQWEKPDLYGEDKFVVMMGGLHIEMASLKMVGHWLGNSGWDGALVQADITTSGRADGILKAAHITRSRYAHQVSACMLYILKRKAYKAYTERSDSEEVDFITWSNKQCELYPQFLFWSTALELELLVLELVKSIREGKFSLYVQVLGKLAPWFFALDLCNYARWLPVHIRDMLALQKKHPSIFSEFTQGKFVVQKSQHHFSKIALDHNHEQENEAIKGDGGAVGLTENPAALRRWMVAGPEIARVVKEFESTYVEQKPNNVHHHEQVPAVQKAFAKDVQALLKVIEEMGNPFAEDSADLIVLDSKEIMSECVVEAVKKAKKTGECQFETYVEERLDKCSKPITDTISRNKLPLFGASEKKNIKTRTQIAALKSDCNLFARLYIACQAREGNLQEFFKHENHASPPSLSTAGGKLRSGQKSELVQCLEVDTTLTCPNVEVKIIDAPVVVNMLPPGKSKSFKDYATDVFVPHIIKQAQYTKRVDLVWDRYLPTSLKQSTRETRGSGVRRRVCMNSAIPVNWKSFLRSDDNKTELFHFLAESISTVQVPGVQIISTYDDDVISSEPVDKVGLTPCNHEEADTRILLHAKHAKSKGYNKIMIRTVDTDVVVLAVAYVRRLGIQELWISFGVGKHLRYLPAHSMASSLTPKQCDALPFFHAVTGCDTVSYLAGRGKRTTWNTWKLTDQATTETFKVLSTPQNSISEEHNQRLERFVVILYSRACPLNTVNEARQSIFAQGTRTIENIPPTQASLEEHVKRAAYQAGHVWGQSLEPIQELPSPSEWGWQRTEEGWTPKWTTLPEASKVCNELISCGCKKACRGLCKCTKANLACTALCFCSGNCFQD